jgi:hypothetical protein
MSERSHSGEATLYFDNLFELHTGTLAQRLARYAQG